jgi:uncharacterized membrane protein
MKTLLQFVGIVLIIGGLIDIPSALNVSPLSAEGFGYWVATLGMPVLGVLLYRWAGRKYAQKSSKQGEQLSQSASS